MTTAPAPSPPVRAPGSSNPPGRPTAGDRFALWALKLAKLRRPRFGVARKEYKGFYEDYFEGKDVEAYSLDRRMTLRRGTVADTLTKHLPPGSSIIDVGCGLGDVLENLPPGYRLHGMDYAESNVRRATQRLGSKAIIRQGSIYEIPFDTGSMDAALCLEVIEHIEDDTRAVTDIARVLKPGGFLVTSVPYQFYWPQYKDLMGHFRHYTRDSFSDLLRRGGLIPEIYLPNYPNWHTAYTRRYPFVRAQHIAAGRLLGGSLYTFKWPWRSQPALARMSQRLEPLIERDAKLDYASLPTSTFILARKPRH